MLRREEEVVEIDSIIKPLQIIRKSSEENDAVMPPHQRNTSPSSGSSPGEEIRRTSMGMSYRRSTTAAATSHSSYDESDNAIVSSQSLNRIINPASPSRTPSSPSKTSRQPAVEQRIKRSGWVTIHALRKFVVRYKLSTLCFVASIVTIGKMHNLALRSLLLSEEEAISSRTNRGIDRQVRGNYRKVRISATNSVSSQTNSRNMLRQFDGGRHPRVVDVAVLGRFVFQHHERESAPPKNYGLLHTLGWKSSSTGVLSSTDNSIAISDEEGIVTTDEGGDNQDAGVVDEEPQCVPMAQWQTTSYPNCNSVHEIDMVRSSGPGTYTFPSYRKEGYGRRSITTYPRSLLNYYRELHQRYAPSRKINAKMNAQGIMQEESIEFLGQGWFRSAWEMYTEEIPDYDIDEERWGFEESVVLKTLRIEREFIPEYYELHRRDALAMERLTFSPYVLDIYGYCGQSAINELANFGIEGMSSLEKVARSFRGMEDIEPVSKIKLQLASMVAAGVSHVHSIDYADFPIPVDNDSSDDDIPDGITERGGVHVSEYRKKRQSILKDIAQKNMKIRSNATLVHYDLNPRNIALVKRGKPKLNDFNVANFLYWDVKNNQTCGFPGRFREPWWRAPEEMHHIMPENYTNPAPLTEKIDIYSLGNILMEILTTHAPWGQMIKGGDKEEETRPKVARGTMPDWPEDFNITKMTKDPALMAIHDAMIKCLQFKPEDRPTAGQIAAELFEAIDNLPEGFGDKEKWRREREMQDQIEEERREMERIMETEKNNEEKNGRGAYRTSRSRRDDTIRPRREHRRDVYEID